MYVWHVRLLIYPESIVFSFVLLCSLTNRQGFAKLKAVKENFNSHVPHPTLEVI